VRGSCLDCGRPISRNARHCHECAESNAKRARAAKVEDYLDLIGLGLTPYEAATRVDVTPRTLYRWRKAGLIP
jgi:hypothetical protein